VTRDINEGSYQAGVGWQTANVGTQRVVIEHALRADTITRITAVVDYNPGGGDFQQALVYVPDYGSTSNSATRLVSATTTGNGLNLTWPASGLGSRTDLTVLQVNIWAGPSGSAVIRSVTIEGEGYFEGQCIPDPQPTATPTPTFTPTATYTPTATFTPTVTPTPTLPPDPRVGTCDSVPVPELCRTGIKLQLDAMIGGGPTYGYEMASVLLHHYLYGPQELGKPRRVPIFANPYKLFVDTAFTSVVQGYIEQTSFDTLEASHMDYKSLYEGKPSNTLPPPITAVPIVWQNRARFSASTLLSAFGTVTVRPRAEVLSTSNTATVRFTYTFATDATGQKVLRIEVSQDIEMYDFYDWCDVDVAYNATANRYRFYSFPDAAAFVPPLYTGALEYDPSTGLTTPLSSDNDVTAPGFQILACPPDEPNQMRLRDNDPATSPFGDPDHPNALKQYIPSLNDFYTGDFTSLEKAKEASAFDIYSSWTQTQVYEVPYQLAEGGIIHFLTSNPTLIEVRKSSLFAQPNDTWSIFHIGGISGVNYVPSALYQPNPRPF